MWLQPAREVFIIIIRTSCLIFRLIIADTSAIRRKGPIVHSYLCASLSLSITLVHIRRAGGYSCFTNMVVGVLALQGSFNEHIAVLRRLGVKGVEIRKPEQLEQVTSLIIPGGESTTMAKLAEFHNLFPALREFVKMGKPVWGTCAGLIFLANKATGQKTGGQELVGGLDCMVHRNFFGSQLQSFEAEVSVPELAAKEGGPETFRGVFIRAPAILEVGPEVEVLADVEVLLDSSSAVESQKDYAGSVKKVIVAVKQGNLLATAFHPELTADNRWHSYFLKMIDEVGEEASSSISTVGEDLSFNQQPRNDLPIFL